LPAAPGYAGFFNHQKRLEIKINIAADQSVHHPPEGYFIQFLFKRIRCFLNYSIFSR
jgi:hypothetical protein